MAQEPVPRDMSYKEIRAILDAQDEPKITIAGMARDMEVTYTAMYRTLKNEVKSDRLRRHAAKCIGLPVEKIWPETYLAEDDPTRKGRPVSRGLYTGEGAAA